MNRPNPEKVIGMVRRIAGGWSPSNENSLTKFRAVRDAVLAHHGIQAEGRDWLDREELNAFRSFARAAGYHVVTSEKAVRS